MLSDEDRSAILEAEVQRFVAQGYRVAARSPTTAQLVRPKTFNVVAAVLWLLVLLVGLLIYLLVYAAQSDDAVYLTVGPDGEIARQFSGGSGRGQHDPARWACEQCGYRNTPSRPRCKRCRVERAVAA